MPVGLGMNIGVGLGYDDQISAGPPGHLASLLLEDGSFLLLEDGSNILLE